jgi:hypothetical protein
MPPYFVASAVDLGKSVEFVPDTAYELVEDGVLVRDEGGEVLRSLSAETRAFKSMAGAVLGALTSMERHPGTTPKVWLYEVWDEPDEDVSGCRERDFRWTEEVRYARPVSGTRCGTLLLGDAAAGVSEDFIGLMYDCGMESGFGGHVAGEMDRLKGIVSSQVERFFRREPHQLSRSM